MSDTNAIDGGYDTARLTASEQDKAWRAERQAKALAFLTSTGNDDVAEILGLTEPSKEPSC
ncbi:hypothetical protein ABZ807_09340 [Micromonospora sp. NPDC047548]|uniref:hypothetical protein n=1 Tax=Micromonospora sp. NPDC047548 TaxID=3155624 RepID=UPI0033E92383